MDRPSTYPPNVCHGVDLNAWYMSRRINRPRKHTFPAIVRSENVLHSAKTKNLDENHPCQSCCASILSEAHSLANTSDQRSSAPHGLLMVSHCLCRLFGLVAQQLELLQMVFMAFKASGSSHDQRQSEPLCALQRPNGRLYLCRRHGSARDGTRERTPLGRGEMKRWQLSASCSNPKQAEDRRACPTEAGASILWRRSQRILNARQGHGA